MAGKKRVAENAAGDNDAEANASPPKATKSRATKAQPVVKANVEPIKRATRKQTAKESAANSGVVTEAATASVANGNAEVKKRVRKGKANIEPSKDVKSDGGSSPEIPKVDVELPKTRSRKLKASKPEEPSKAQEKKVAAKKGPAKAKPLTATLNNGAETTNTKETKLKRGAKKVETDEAATVEPVKAGPSKAGPSKVGPTKVESTKVESTKVETTKVEPSKRGRKQKVEESTKTAAASIAAEKPKKRIRNVRGAKANTVDQNEGETEAPEQVDEEAQSDDSPATVAEPVKAEPKKRARKAKA